MANTAGGKILLGVRDDGTVKGIPDSNELRTRIQDIARNCDPPVRVLVERLGEVTVVTVRESDVKPVQCRDGFFWRQGAATQKLTRDEIRDFSRSEGSIRFDLSPCTKFRYPQDFDHQKFDAWLRMSGITGKPRTEDVLVNIEAAERAGGRLVFRNSGVLFFGRNVRHFFHQAYITCLWGKGADKVHVLDLVGKAALEAGELSGERPPTRSSDPVARLLVALKNKEASSGDLRRVLGVKHRPTFRKNYLHPALDAGFIQQTIPEKPGSRLQRYRLTPAGIEQLKKIEGTAG